MNFKNKEKLKKLEISLTNLKTQTLETYIYSKKSLQVLDKNHYMASGLIITITDLQGVDKFKCCITDGLSDEILKAINDKLENQISSKLKMLGLK